MEQFGIVGVVLNCETIAICVSPRCLKIGLDRQEEESTQEAEEDDESESRVEQDRLPELRVSNSTLLDQVEEEEDTETNVQVSLSLSLALFIMCG